MSVFMWCLLIWYSVTIRRSTHHPMAIHLSLPLFLLPRCTFTAHGSPFTIATIPLLPLFLYIAAGAISSSRLDTVSRTDMKWNHSKVSAAMSSRKKLAIRNRQRRNACRLHRPLLPPPPPPRLPPLAVPRAIRGIREGGRGGTSAVNCDARTLIW